ncbi:hypothetical protein PsorP6_004433 [Peronosclerospora sorghi]|uniref:Uncharacterized protein n=1 Tax=Peronosclerospora sorghi TaxID=230839 RepID=A0ACC0VK47_9STRA|nr:hypothetical protein PsorP6_004433 [Peronosclerospora sorghi]
MSANMLRLMLVDAAALLKAESYHEAQEAGRRVTQFDPNNFQAFMCVGLASFHLKQWEDCEEAYRRAAELKPELPAPWKHLVDLFEAKKDVKSKLAPLEKLVDINLRGNKIKRCQKWVAEVATTALELKMFPKAFDSWYSLVGKQSGELELSLEKTPNEDLPSLLHIWLDLADLLQRPGFSLSDCKGSYSMDEISSQFFAVASHSDWSAQKQEDIALWERMDAAIAYFMRFHLDTLKHSAKESAILKTVDALAVSIIEWFPEAKTPAEFLLLRSEDQDSRKFVSSFSCKYRHVMFSCVIERLTIAIEFETAKEIATRLHIKYPKSPMALARERLAEAFAGYSSSTFQECALCVRAQVEFASLALASHDVEACLHRLAVARKVVADKAKALVSKGPLSNVYSEDKVVFMTACACEHSGESDKALELYRRVLGSADVRLAVRAAIAAAELLAGKGEFHEAMNVIDSVSLSTIEDESLGAIALCLRGWMQYQLGDLEEARMLLEANLRKIELSDMSARGRALKRVAIVYWHVGGTLQTAKTGCFGQLLQAAKLTPSDGEIFSWLGKWYQEIANDILRAEKCYLKALSLSSWDEQAGMNLSKLYDMQGNYEANVRLWEQVTKNNETAPTWALLRLVQHLVEQHDETAVEKMHLLLRHSPGNAQYWVILAHIYRTFEKHVSARKSYLKAIELGEESWCVRCELARIEGFLLLFDDALGRIKPVVMGKLSDEEPDLAVASMLYSNLLFQQAKYLCADGLYGKAAENLKEAACRTKQLLSTFSESVEAHKLMGDIHCFAFYLSPEDFTTEESSWIDFISEGRIAYETAARMSETQRPLDGVVMAERYYDLGLSYWYQVQALNNMQGRQSSAFSTRDGEEDAAIATMKANASLNFKLALEHDPACSLAWNGLALVSNHVLIKQFAWARSIQTSSNFDAAWANLGMFYLTLVDTVPSVTSLAQKSLLQLQSVNPSNPAMWNGYAMLARGHASSRFQQRKIIEAFDCALQTGLDLDALLGLSLALLTYGDSVGESITDAPEHGKEQIMFYLKKYLERDPFNGTAWHALGMLQHRLGLYSSALISYTRAASLPQAPETHEWDTLLATLGDQLCNTRSASTDETAVLQKITAHLNTSGETFAALQVVLHGLNLYREAKGNDSLDILQALLSKEEHELSKESESIALIGLSLSSLLMDKCMPQATRLATACKTYLLLSLDQAPATLSCRDYRNLRFVELHERWIGAEDASRRRLQTLWQAHNGSSNLMLWMRLALLTIDSQGLEVSHCLAEYLQSGASSSPTPGKETMDHIVLDALLGLFKSSTSGTKQVGSDSLKLVRTQPWNPHAYIMAGASVLKRMCLEPKQEAFHDVLRPLVRLLQTGLLLSVGASGYEYSSAQLELLMSYCLVKLGEHDEAIATSTRALNRVVADKKSGAMTQSLDTDLLEARLLSISNPAEAIKKYLTTIATVSDGTASCSGRFVPILMELGGLYEEQEHVDAAITVWKLVVTLTATKSDEIDDEVSSAATLSTANCDLAAGFLANLRLSLLHGKRNNVKSARKYIKVARTIADASLDATSSTVVAFVESVLASTR